MQGWWQNTSARVSQEFCLKTGRNWHWSQGEDPFLLDLEWNKPVATAHPLGIDIEVPLLQNFKTKSVNLYKIENMIAPWFFYRSLQTSLLPTQSAWLEPWSYLIMFPILDEEYAWRWLIPKSIQSQFCLIGWCMPTLHSGNHGEGNDVERCPNDDFYFSRHPGATSKLYFSHLGWIAKNIDTT